MVHTHLVTWQEFMREKENKNLSITEAKGKYQKLEKQFNLLMEAENAAYNAVALNSVRNGSQGGPGEELNPILGIEFLSLPTGTIAGFVSSINVSYKFPVTVIGTPVIYVNNGQQGKGSADVVTYTATAGGSTNVVTFYNTQGADANGGTLVAAKQIAIDKELIGSITTQPTTPVDDTYVDESAIVWASGAGGSGGVDVTGTIIVSGGAVTSIKVTVAAGSYQPGNVFTLAGSALGGTGNLVFTLVSADLTGDTLTFQAEGNGISTGVVTSEGNTINLLQGGGAGEAIGSKYDSVGGAIPTQLGTPATATA
tara:strand:+ start:2429 stop:3361 length:933 start_codon:yes stop_codon:yes gene_type:complete